MSGSSTGFDGMAAYTDAPPIPVAPPATKVQPPAAKGAEAPEWTKKYLPSAYLGSTDQTEQTAPAAPSNTDWTSKYAPSVYSTTPQPPEPEKPGTWSGAAKSFLAGIPVGVAGLADFAASAGPAKVARDLYEGVSRRSMPTAHQTVKDFLTKPGADGSPPLVNPPVGATERIAAAAGEGVGSSIISGGGLAGLATNIAVGGLGSAMARFFAETFAAPENRDTVSALATIPATLATAGGAMALEKGARAAGAKLGAMGVGVKPVLDEAGKPFPGVAATDEQLAAVRGRLTTALDSGAVPGAAGPTPAEAAIQTAGGAGSTVPGVQRTTAQQTQNPVLSDVERRLRSGPAGPQFAAQDEANAAALSEFAGSVRPPGAIAQTPGRMFVDRLRDMEAQNQAALTPLQTAAQRAGEPIQIASGRGISDIGEDLRTVTAQARAPEKVAAGQPWDELRANPDIRVSMQPTFAAARTILGDLLPGARGTTEAILSSEGAAPTTTSIPAGQLVVNMIRKAVNNPETVTFDRLADLMSDISDTQRTLRALDNGAYAGSRFDRMLGDFKKSFYDSIALTVDQTAAREAALVATGAMSPADTLMSRMAAAGGGATEQRVGNVAATGRAAGAAAGDGAVPQPLGAGGADGATIPPGALPGGAGRNPGLAGEATPSLTGPSTPLTETPNMTAAEAQKYLAAREAYAKYADKWKTGPIGDILLPGPTRDSWRFGNAEIINRFFSQGNRSAEEAAKLVQTLGEDTVMPIARQVFANDLKARGALLPDGTLDAGKFALWERDTKNRDLLRLFPQLGDEFGSAAKAQQTLAETMKAQGEATKAFQKSVARFFLERDGRFALDPETSVKRAFAAGPRELREIHSAMSASPDALAGWQAAVSDHLSGILSRDKPAFRTFVTENWDSIKAVFGGQGASRLRAVADEIARQSVRPAQGGAAAAAIPGAAGEHTNPAIVMLLAEHLAERVMPTAAGSGAILPATIGAVTAKMAAVMNRLEAANIKTQGDLLNEAMRNPAFFKVLMTRVKPEAVYAPSMVRRIGASLAAANTASGETGER